MNEQVKHGRDGELTVREICDQCGDPKSGCCRQLVERRGQRTEMRLRHARVVDEMAVALEELRERVAKADALMVETYAGAYVYGPTVAYLGQLRALLRGE